MIEYFGVDISKQSFDAYSNRLGSNDFANTPEGFRKFTKWIKRESEGSQRVVLEATGGYHTELFLFLQTQGIPVSVVNPKRARDFAKAMGVFAKTDKIDAKVLAQFGYNVCPPETKPVSSEVRELNELVVRRDQLVEQCTQEKNRLEHAKKVVRQDIRGHIKILENRIKKMENLIKETINRHSSLKKKSDFLQSVKGIGAVSAAVLLAKLPELGQWSSKSIAALVGVAPFPDDSGKRRGSRRIFGGREQVRSVLYMCTLSATRSNPQIRQFYRRLLGEGKAKKVAIVACIRKLLVVLNALLTKEERWDETKGAA